MDRRRSTIGTTAKRGEHRGVEKGRQPSVIRWNLLGASETRLLLYRIAQWRIEGDESGKRLAEEEIAAKLRTWVPKHIASEAYNPKGVFTARWVGERFKDAIVRGYVTLGKYSEPALADRIRELLSPPYPEIVVAPDLHELQRYVWEALDTYLTAAVRRPQRKEIIIGVSGGQTLLGLARRISDLANLNWWSIAAKDKDRVKVCSLTSGGIPSDIAALSDAVAGTVGTSLGIRAKGLLGPAWFIDDQALAAFRRQPHVAEHETMVKHADIIVTSVGNLRDPNSLMAHLFREQGEGAFLENQPHPADILYKCYDGLSGDPIPLPADVASGLFSVIDLEELKHIERRIVVAGGLEKGRHALPGVLRKNIATDVFMDLACAQGLIQALQA
ncbi:MAG: hypothetical protein KBE65_04250 [Phycisphaerae bacterium]|nr:hypothetical protein [Phycisphaerae bacterium]